MTASRLQKISVARAYWLVKLRWVALAGVILTVFFVRQVLKLSLPIFSLYSVAVLLGIYNLIIFFYLKYIRKTKIYSSVINRITNLQISLDLLSLALLIHFSGGIENPFIFYFIFHMIIASILLSRRDSFLQATFAVCLFSAIVGLEYFGILSHYSLKGFIASGTYNNFTYITGISFVFISTVYIATYMATSVSERLRKQDMNLRKANELLTEKDRAKSEYVLRLTHDIKEHLAAIQGCIEPVIDGITGVLNEKQKNLLQRADKRATKLSFFVRALLEISRIKLSKQDKADYFSINAIVNNAIACIETRAKDKNIMLTVHVDAAIDKIKGVETYIEETISNLLANSVKYTRKNGKINLDVTDKGEFVLIKIEEDRKSVV